MGHGEGRFASVNASATLFDGVDRSLFAAAFGEGLRRAGVRVSMPALERCATALDLVQPTSLGDLYWVLRLAMLSDHGDLDRFDEVFARVFDTDAGRLASRRRGQSAQSGRDEDRLATVRTTSDDEASAGLALPWATLPSVAFADDQDPSADDAMTLPELRPSTLGTAMDRPFDLLDPVEAAEVERLVESALVRWPQRTSRSLRQSSSTGTVSMRRSMRTAARTGGDVVSLIRMRNRPLPRPIVALLDVSGSMESYARAYLHLMRPLANAHRSEVFVFATELTRITAQLRRRSARDAIDAVTDAVGDRFAGTRIGTSLHTLLHHRRWNTSVRGAVVVIVSDGWDADDPELLERQMKRLALLAYRIIWVNPRAAAPDFAPLTGGMAAALPYCDVFLAGNTGAAIADVVAAITAP